MDKSNVIASSHTMDQNICRLCSVKSELIDLFAPKNANLSMRILILLATGIEIKATDIVSKKVCQRCCDISVKLHKYRTNAVANDKLLKEKIGLPYSPPITDQKELLRVASGIANGQNGASTSNNSRSNSDALHLLNLSFKKDAARKIKFRAKSIYKHPSIRKVYKTYKNIILPMEVLKSDISPVIALDSSEVSDWYTEQLATLKSKLKGVTIKGISNIPAPHFSSFTVPVKSREEPKIIHKITPLSRSLSSKINGKKCKFKEAKPRAATPHSEPTMAVDAEKSYETTEIPKKRNVKRVYSKIIDSSSDDDDINKDFCHSIYERDDDFQPSSLSTVPSVSPRSSLESVPSHSRSHKQPTARKKLGRTVTKRKRISSEEDKTRREKNSINDSSVNLLDKEANPIDAPQKISKTRKSTEFPLKIAKRMDSTEFRLNGTYSPLLTHPEKELNTSYMDSALPELIKSKTLEIFMCSVCNKLHDTKKELAEHEKTHLTCQFCKQRLRNVAALNKHQNETCYINIVKSKVFVKLDKVDTIPSIVNQYPEAFQNNSSKSSEKPKETHPDIEEVVLPMPVAGTFLENELKNENASPEIQTISISDDSGDEVSCIESGPPPAHKIAENPFAKSNYGNVASTTIKTPVISENESSSGPKNVLKEKEMIRSLFKKHSYPATTVANESQTFTASNHNIKYTKTNLIILDSMFPELSAYKIPIYLESQGKISARFKENSVIPQESVSLECWAFKTPIDVTRKRTLVVAKPLSTPTNPRVLTVVPANLSPTTKITSFKIPPEMLFQRRITNTTVPRTNTTLSNVNTVPFTISSPPGTSLFNGTATTSSSQRTNNIIQLLEPSSTIQYQTPIIQQSPASLVFGMNQNQQGNPQPQSNVLHINNNVTNVNKFFLLSNPGQPMPTGMTNLNGFGPAYLNNLCASMVLPAPQPLQLREIESGDQNSNNSTVVLCDGEDEPVQNANNSNTNRLRVKNISELN